MRRAADFESTTPVATNRSTQDGISFREICVDGNSCGTYGIYGAETVGILCDGGPFWDGVAYGGHVVGIFDVGQSIATSVYSGDVSIDGNRFYDK